jgi:hypothetical protein
VCYACCDTVNEAGRDLPNDGGEAKLRAVA